jgi:CBS domain-containing protein
MDVHAIMNGDVQCAGPESTLADVARLMRDARVGAVPIVREGSVVGIVTDRDICLAVAESAAASVATSAVRVDAVMSRDVACCEPDEDLAEALAKMSSRRVWRLPVVDEGGRICGILSIDDIIGRFSAPNGETLSALKTICAGRARTRKERRQRSADERPVASPRPRS